MVAPLGKSLTRQILHIVHTDIGAVMFVGFKDGPSVRPNRCSFSTVSIVRSLLVAGGVIFCSKNLEKNLSKLVNSGSYSNYCPVPPVSNEAPQQVAHHDAEHIERAVERAQGGSGAHQPELRGIVHGVY